MTTSLCSCAVCRGTLATALDEVFLEGTFVPMMVPCEHLASPQPPVQSPKGLEQAIEMASAEEIAVEIPTLEALRQAVRVTLSDRAVPKAVELAERLDRFMLDQARTLHDDLTQELRAAALNRLPGTSVAKSTSAAEALKRLAGQLQKRFEVFLPQPAPIVDKPRKAQNLCTFDEIGTLFLERLRVRPLGHTVERAPFYQLSVEPGETISLTHESFSQRDFSQEEIFSKEETFESSLTSVLNSSLSTEYSTNVSKVSNWKISSTHSGEMSLPIKMVKLNIKQTQSGEYGSTTTNSSSTKEAASQSRTVTQTSASKLTRSHRTTVKIARTDRDTLTTARTFTNNSTKLKKIYMRKMVRVHHLSYERYGVRLAWSPCIEDPGRDVRDLIPGAGAFPKEIQAIRDKWNQTPPPTELGSPPEPQTIYTDWSGLLKGSLSQDFTHDIAIPTGYVFADAFLEKKDIRKDPGVSIDGRPAAGATGVVQLLVHVGLRLVPRDEVRYQVGVIAAPGPLMMSQWNAKVQSWRDEQAQKEIDAFLADKQDQLKGVDQSAWPPSELMRRAIGELFGDPADYHSCDIVEMLHRVFEWENLSYQLFAPWWNPSAKVDGLQSLATTFLNASWAKLYVPLRPGYEEDAISFLASVGAIPQQQDLLNDIEYYLDDMRQNVEPLFKRDYAAGPPDAPEIDGPCDILLTELGDKPWRNAFESQLKFQVLDRWTVTTPTDGVDYEEAYAMCPLSADGEVTGSPQVTAGLGTGSVGGNIIVELKNAGSTAVTNLRVTGVSNVSAGSPNVIVWDQGVVGAPGLTLPWVWGTLGPGQAASRNFGFKATAGHIEAPFSFTITYAYDGVSVVSAVVTVPKR